jgi:hypothetical protein
MKRLYDKPGAAEYLSVSEKTVERLIYSGMLPTVKLPVERGKNGKGRPGVSRRILVDVQDLDRLIEQSKERPE